MSGFLTYNPEEGVSSITPEFMADLKAVCRKQYGLYRLNISLEDFTSEVTEHLMRSLEHYDPRYNIATFIWSIVWQKAWDIHKGVLGREDMSDATDLLLTKGEAEVQHGISKELDFEFRDGLLRAAKELYDGGIVLNQKRCYLDFLQGEDNPLVNAVLWCYVLDPDELRPGDGRLQEVLFGMAEDLGIPREVAVSMYLVVGTGLFFILNTLRGNSLAVSKGFKVRR